MRLINAAHLTAFMALYEPALLAVVSAPDRSGYAYGPEQVPQVAAKMSAALASGSYNHDGAAAFLEEVDGKIRVYFEAPVHAITPGQAAVFYDGPDVLGGGWIERHVIGEFPLPFAALAAGQ